MICDPNIIRTILLSLEADEPDTGDFTQEERSYHVFFAGQEGLLMASRTASVPPSKIGFIPLYLTSAGHDFLAISRDQARWDSTVSRVTESLGYPDLDSIRTVLLEECRASLSDVLDDNEGEEWKSC